MRSTKVGKKVKKEGLDDLISIAKMDGTAAGPPTAEPAVGAAGPSSW